METGSGTDWYSDDELASALEEQVARMTAAIPVLSAGAQRTVFPQPEPAAETGDEGWVRPPGPPISFEETPVRRWTDGPQPTFSAWVGAAVPRPHEAFGAGEPSDRRRPATALPTQAPRPTPPSPVVGSPLIPQHGEEEETAPLPDQKQDPVPFLLPDCPVPDCPVSPVVPVPTSVLVPTSVPMPTSAPIPSDSARPDAAEAAPVQHSTAPEVAEDLGAPLPEPCAASPRPGWASRMFWFGTLASRRSSRRR